MEREGGRGEVGESEGEADSSLGPHPKQTGQKYSQPRPVPEDCIDRRVTPLP